MTKSEGLALLESAPQDPTIISAVNRGMTQAQAVEIIRKGLVCQPDDVPLSPLYEKRVKQMAHPRY
jgi:hypothetical protein